MRHANAQNNEESAQENEILSDSFHHDMCASIIVANGFNTALRESLTELHTVYRTVLNSCHVSRGADNLGNLEKIEADCHFCVNRIEQLLQKLSDQDDTAAGPSGRSAAQCSDEKK